MSRLMSLFQYQGRQSVDNLPSKSASPTPIMMIDIGNDAAWNIVQHHQKQARKKWLIKNENTN